jgi:hypothetical protein
MGHSVWFKTDGSDNRRAPTTLVLKEPMLTATSGRVNTALLRVSDFALEANFRERHSSTLL